MEISKYQVIIQKDEFNYLMELKDNYHDKIKEIEEQFRNEFNNNKGALYECNVRQIEFIQPTLDSLFKARHGYIRMNAYAFYYEEKKSRYDDVYFYTNEHKKVYDELNELHKKNIEEIKKANKLLNKYFEKYGLLDDQNNDSNEVETKEKKKSWIRNFWDFLCSL